MSSLTVTRPTPPSPEPRPPTPPLSGSRDRTHRRVDVHDHLPARLVALAVVGALLLLLQHAVARGPVLQRKLAEDLAEAVHADLTHAVGRVAQEQQEGMEPEVWSERRERRFFIRRCR